MSVIAPPRRKRAPSVRKTSFEVDFDKLEAARELLGTRTLTETVDAALDEVVKREQRRALVELLFAPGVLEIDDPDVMAGAWR
ncbi:MAG TPA: type II toxin-antitoxin system VapB family antitoxin [Conexibacter sp.]|nr:type II toxin-antitoxin system VapB family antitoxin [Conexibacter sp.]